MSDPQKTLDYWHTNYEWARDKRLVKMRGDGLGKMIADDHGP